MSGYYADRMEGPSSGNWITFAGPITVDSSVSASHPFQLIGRGKEIAVTADESGFHTLPLKLYNASDVTAMSKITFYAGATYSGETLDIGSHNAVMHGAGFVGGDPDPVVYACETLNIHDGGMIDDPRYGIALGKNKSVSVSVMEGSSITGGSYLRLGWQTDSVGTPITAFMGITNATVSAGGTQPQYGKVFTLMDHVTGSFETENCRVVLGPGGTVDANMISHYGGGMSRILFDGGKYASNKPGTEALSLFHVYGYDWNGSWHSPVMYLEGINGNPIDIEIACTRNLSDGISGTARKINFTGTGGFTKRGAGTLVFNRKDGDTGTSICDYTGPTTILGGGIVVTNATFKPGRGELSVSEGAFLDLNGFDVEFCGATGAGTVTNGAEATSSLTLGYGDADAAFSIAIGERLNVVKTGSGTLTISGAALANACNLTVESGKVVFGGNSSSYGTVTVEAGATLDTTGTRFSCANLVTKPGSILLPPYATVIIMR